MHFVRNVCEDDDNVSVMTMYLSIVARVLWFYKDIFIQVLRFLLFIIVHQF